MIDTDVRVGGGRKAAGTAWNAWRGVVGTLFVAAALGNLAFTPRNPGPLFDFLAQDVSLRPIEALMSTAIAPHALLFVLAAVVFELAVGGLILSRGSWVDLGLVGAVGFQVFLLPFLTPFNPYALGGRAAGPDHLPA